MASIRTTLVFVLATTVAICTAAPASADDIDFTIALDDHGIPYSSMSDIIAIGKQACSSLRAGWPVTITQAIAAGTPTHSVGAPITAAGYVPVEAAIITVAATINMCPDQLPRLTSAASGSQPLTTALQAFSSSSRT